MAEIVKFTGSNDELFCRESADNLHAAAQVVVPETHTVLLIKDGIVSEALGAGRHDIFDTQNGLFRLKKDSDVATVDFVYISKTAKLPMLWGTSTPIKMRDPETDVPISIGVNGELEFRVKTPKQFYLELVGAEADYSVDKLKRRVLSRLLSVIEPEIARLLQAEKIGYTSFAARKREISTALKQKVSEFFASEYGLELCSFSVNGAIVSDADFMAIERKRNELNAGIETCPECGKQVKKGSKFCNECGAALGDKTCKHCGGIVPAGSKFCPECGAKVK